MTQTPAPAVLTELRGHVLVVTLDRAEARNAVNAELTQGLGDLAEVVAANAPLSVQASTRIALGLRDGDLPSERDGWQANNDEMGALFSSEDPMEGLAFAEERTPVWKAR